MIGEIWTYLSSPGNWQGSDGFAVRILEHLQYVGGALLVAFAFAFPLGLLIGHTNRGVTVAVNAVNASRSLPSLGLLTLVVLFSGLGRAPVLVALTVLAIPPILNATYAGVRGVDKGAVTAARGMGMTEPQVVWQVELPVALPLVWSGIRSATLQTVATATIAAYVALGGLGRYVIDGFAVREFDEMLAGALLVSLLAITLDLVLALATRLSVSPGLRDGGRQRLPRAVKRFTSNDQSPAPAAG
ncbi:ABC transporter permease subunit [soil metagenome]